MDSDQNTRRAGSIIRVFSIAEAQEALNDDPYCSGILINVPRTDAVDRQLAQLSPDQAKQYERHMPSPPATMRELNAIFGEVAGHTRKIQATYDQIVQPYNLVTPACSDMMFFAGGCLDAALHFDASKPPFAVSKLGHFHLAGQGMRLLSVTGANTIKLLGDQGDASRDADPESLRLLTCTPGVQITPVDMQIDDLLVFDQTALHGSSPPPAADTLKLRGVVTTARAPAVAQARELSLAT